MKDKELLQEYKNMGVPVRTFPTRKDYTDTHLAMMYAKDLYPEEVIVFGATGTRLDHVLGNISLLGIGFEEQISMELLAEHNRIRMIQKPLTLEKDAQYGKYVSLIPYGGDVQGITLRGFKYPLSDYTMGGFNSLGISNEIVDEKAVIELTGGSLLVIESHD